MVLDSSVGAVPVHLYAQVLQASTGEKHAILNIPSTSASSGLKASYKCGSHMTLEDTCTNSSYSMACNVYKLNYNNKQVTCGCKSRGVNILSI